MSKDYTELLSLVEKKYPYLYEAISGVVSELVESEKEDNDTKYYDQEKHNINSIIAWYSVIASNIGSLTMSRDEFYSVMQYLESQEKKISDLEYKLLGVMHSVDKWLDDDELDQDEVNRAATMREKTLRIVEEKIQKIQDLENRSCPKCTHMQDDTVSEYCVQGPCPHFEEEI